MSKKTTIFTIIVVGLIIFGIYQIFLKKEESTFTLFEVSRGVVIQEVSETGMVKKGEKINLSFKNSGLIDRINVKTGDSVESGQVLAQLDTDQLLIQLQEGQASLRVAQAKLDKLLAGSSQEEIKIAETDVRNKEIALETAQENLDQAYDDALNTLNDSYLTIYNAFNKVKDIQIAYFTSNDQESIKVKDAKTKIENTMSSTKFYLDAADNATNETIDTALSEMNESLEEISSALAVIREICEQPFYRVEVSATDKTSIDTLRGYINTALTNVTNDQQTITSKKLSVSSAEGNLEAAKDQLNLVLADPRKEDIDLYQAQMEQAQSQIDLIEIKIRESKITSPTSGQIVDIGKEKGEVVQATEIVLSLISDNPFQVTVDIYEEDIVKINVGNPVDITLTAFADEILKGKVVSIDPIEKLIEGVVYYETTIDFESLPKNIKPGMTVDVIIKTASRENVLVVPEEAVNKKDGRAMVQVLIGETPQEKEIEIGLIGSNDMVEIVAGLKEGQKVIIK